jgi:hypothetical protein
VFGRRFKDELEREQAWLREHEAEYLVATECYDSIEALRAMLDGCALALATLGCLTNETSPVMAGHVIGTAESQLEAALKNRTTIQTYEGRKANYEAMKESGSPLPDLGLGAARGESDRER